jgi:hypothetical protein
MKDEIIIYQPDNKSTRLEVRIEEDTVWLTQAQMVELFSSTKQNISLHINNIFKEEELEPESTVKEYLIVQKEGSRSVKRKIFLYNLDVIISVGYRVKSKRGTQFRIWASRVLKEYLLKGYAVNNRIDGLEYKVHKIQDRLEEIDFQVKTNLPPREGIFFEGQVFDAWVFVNGLVRSAKQRIVLIDNYVDESVLLLLSKRKKGVTATIHTRHLTKQLLLDAEKHNAQYPKIEIRSFSHTHDRFLILDNKMVYHIGASLKDLGKRWFAFSKMEMNAEDLIEKLHQKSSR